MPTYNEASNIANLLEQLFSREKNLQYKNENVIMKVLVVDDNSPDGTASVVRSYSKKNKNVHLLLRSEKKGLGAAYIAGMQHAVGLLQPDIIFEMDADLSHNPEYVLPMIREVMEGADFVIGSRYIRGGSIPEDWGLGRKLISRAANMYVRALLRMSVHDCTGGFRAIRVSALEKVDLGSLNVKGYAFQVSLLQAIISNGAVVKEIPIDFHDRTKGKSKMRISDVVEVFLSVVRMAMPTPSFLLKPQNEHNDRIIKSRAQKNEF